MIDNTKNLSEIFMPVSGGRHKNKINKILTDRRNTTHPITKSRNNIPRVGWYK